MTTKLYVCNWEYYHMVIYPHALWISVQTHMNHGFIFDIKIHYVQGRSKPPNLRLFKHIATKDKLIISMIPFSNELLQIMNIL